MNDRNAFLAAIRDQHDDDTPRLVYADWLDEHAVDDRDTATAEFIRASCLRRNHRSGYMPRKAYRWLHDNWRRLIPLTLELHVPKWYERTPTAEERLSEHLWYRKGRTIELALWMSAVPDDGALIWCWMELEFNRGFLQWWETRHVDAFARVRDKLTVDQPLAKPRSFPVAPNGSWRH